MRVVDPEGNEEYRLTFQYNQTIRVLTTVSGQLIFVNGVTMAILTSEKDGAVYDWAEAYCSEYDQFDKIKGRTVALRRLGNQLSRPFRTAMWEAVLNAGVRVGGVPQR
jgi:hypothetical protein